MSRRQQIGEIGDSPYGKVDRPRSRQTPIDVKELLKEQIIKPEIPEGYQRFGPGDPRIANSAEVSDSSGPRGGGGAKTGGSAVITAGSGANSQVINIPPVVFPSLQNVTITSNWGISDTYLFCDSQFAESSSVRDQGRLVFSVVGLNNGKPIDTIIEMEIGSFYIPNVDNFPPTMPIPYRFFYKRVTLRIDEMVTQSVFGANQIRHHWELEQEGSGIANLLTPVNKKFVFTRPFRDVSQLSFQFATPAGNLPLPRDVFITVPLRNTNPGRFLLTNNFTPSQFDYIVAPISPSITLVGGGALSAGRYRWLVTFVTKTTTSPPGLETDAGIPSIEVTAAGGNAGTLTNIPVDIWGATTPVNIRTQTRRRIYRTIADGNIFYFVDEIVDNTTTTYLDTRSDAMITGTVAYAPPPAANSTNKSTAPTLNSTGGSPTLIAYHELVLYRAIPSPPAPSVSIQSGGGSLSASIAGGYQWLVTFINGKGETIAGASFASVGPSNSGDRAVLSSIPLGDTGTLARNVYRTTAGGTTYRFAFTINNNTETTAVDKVADNALTGSPPTIDGTGGQQYTVYITNIDLNNGTLNSILNSTQGHLADAIDASVVELANTSGSAIANLPFGVSRGIGSLSIGFRRIAFQIRFRSLVRSETNRILPV